MPGHFLWITWIDREGIIVSSRFSLSEHLPLVLVLLLVLQRFDHRQWGEISELTRKDHSVPLHPVNADGTLCEGEVGVIFHPEDKVHSGWSLLGRATTVVGASSERDEGGAPIEEREVYNMGDNFAGTAVDGGFEDAETGGAGALGGEDGAQSASDQARNAYRKARDNITKLHNLILKISWPEKSRIPEWEIVARAQKLGETDELIRGHVPEVKFGRNFDEYSTHHVRNFLKLHDKQTGTRTLRLVVMNRLRPIHDLEGGQLWVAFWQCFRCTLSPHTVSQPPLT